MALRSIELVVPPGYFCQLLYSLCEKRAGYSLSIPHFMSSASPNESTLPKTAEMTCALKRREHLNHNRRTALADYSILLLFYRLRICEFAPNLGIVRREIGNNF